MGPGTASTMGGSGDGDQPDNQMPAPAAARNPTISAGLRSWSREICDHGRSQRPGGGGMENGRLSISTHDRRVDGSEAPPVSAHGGSPNGHALTSGSTGMTGGTGMIGGSTGLTSGSTGSTSGSPGTGDGRSRDSVYGMRPRGLTLRPWPWVRSCSLCISPPVSRLISPSLTKVTPRMGLLTVRHYRSVTNSRFQRGKNAVKDRRHRRGT